MPKPKPSEWGKLSAGQTYIFWAIDLARAVSAVGLGENTGILFWYVAENSFGSIRTKRRGEWPDPVPVEINQSELAGKFGVTKQRVYDAENWLSKARMIVPGTKGYYVNKNAHEWVHPVSGAPLVSGKRLAYALEARSRTDKSDKESPSNVTPLPINEHENDKVTLERYSGNVTPLPEGVESNGVTLPATIGTRASEDSTQTKEDSTQSRGPDPPVVKTLPASPDPSMPGGTYDPKLCPPYPDDGDILVVKAGPHVLTDAEGREVFLKLWQAFGSARICQDFFEEQRAFPAAVWVEAARALFKAGLRAYSLTIVLNKAGEVTAKSNGRQTRASPFPEKPAPAVEYHTADADSPFRKLNEEARKKDRQR